MSKLVIERGRKWQLSEVEPRTIALDGAIPGPYFDAEHGIFSFDHHEGCIRGISLSACEQARDFVLLGLDPTGFTILLNDIDLDSALGAWLLMNPNRVSEPLVEKLVYAAGRQDAHCGAYPVKEVQGVLEWIAEPETKMRADGSYGRMSNDGLSFVMESIWRRIEQFIDGKGNSEDYADMRPEEHSFELVKKGSAGSNWSLVKFLGDRPTRELARANINRWVGFRELDDKTLCVSIGKKSDVTNGFPVGPADKEGTILNKLSKLEPGWGGSTTIGGSPRNADGSGTKLTLDQIFAVVEEVVKPFKEKPKEKSKEDKKKT